MPPAADGRHQIKENLVPFAFHFVCCRPLPPPDRKQKKGKGNKREEQNFGGRFYNNGHSPSLAHQSHKNRRSEPNRRAFGWKIGVLKKTITASPAVFAHPIFLLRRYVLAAPKAKQTVFFSQINVERLELLRYENPTFCVEK